ncbi:MAG: DNA primase [Bdellovibrionales bacterium RIFCSPHIGHO2_01_FULL_40_29]|nr:MAG: DNA primase [Bdellovibrionales bacterium RIFCSPHIGHO2_01_FULL_40_29]OFZ33221.1 MAG: DNA primase [Bdellovibrionales bacterium RIFCSPHIGHO2_02_FULL_40_15]
MRYPPEFVDRVSEANNVVDIISQYTQLKQSGGGYMGRCPFPDHAEKTASFSVSESKQVYHCFGCKKSGNIFSFLKDYNGMSFPEAIEYLAERASIPLPETQRDDNDQYAVAQDKKKQMLRANKIADDFYRETLKRASSTHPIKTYVQKRKLSIETIEEFHIGYAPSEWDMLANHLDKKNISASLADEARLTKPRKEGNGSYDIFRDRLMFPILSPSGEVLAFGGRIHDQGEPKYLNSPETLVFNKSKVLYGLAHTARYIRPEDLVVVVEGYMDLVSLFQAGIRNVAATMGTALTPEHAKLIKRMTNNVVVLFDSDEAGQRAAERSLPLLLAAGLYPRGLILTEAKDPDEFVTQFGVEALQKKIHSAPELFNVVLQMWMVDYRGEASQKVKVMDQARPVFDVIPDPRLKSLYAQEIAARMNVGLDWVRSALTSTQGRQNYREITPAQVTSNQPKPAAEAPKKPLFSITGASSAEILLLQLALKSRANFEVMLNQQILSQINHLGVKSILEKAEQVYRQDPNKFDKLLSLLIENLDKPELLFSSSMSSTSEFDEEKENKMLSDCFKRIQQTFLKEQAKKLGMALKQNVDPEKLKEIEDLQRNRLSLNKNEK